MDTPRRLTVQDLGRRPEAGLDAPGSAVFAPDGRSVSYLFSADGTLVRSLWRHNLLTGDRSLLVGPLPETTSDETLSRDEALERERTGMLELGVTGYAWAGEGANTTLLVPMAGRLHVSMGADATRIQALPGIDRARGAQLSPDGSYASYTADGDLYVVPLRDGRPQRLTDDAEPGVFNGLAEFIASEELKRFDGAWWSADSGSIAFAHVDERRVAPYVIRHDPAHPPVEEVYRYPFPGGPNAQVSLRVTSVAGRGWREVELDMRPDDYLARVVSHPAGGWLAAVLSRDQRSLTWHRVGSDGSAERRWVETADAWINVDDHTRVVPDGRILRSSERSGFRHLELRAPSGELDRVLTAGEWVVTDVVAVSATRREVLFVATRDGVLERHLYSVPLDASEPVGDPARLTVEPGWHSIVAGDGGERWIDTWSDLENAPRVTVSSRSGDVTLLHASSTTSGGEGLEPPELIELQAADGETHLQAALYRAARRPGADGPPAAVVWVYGGPHSQYVMHSWELTVHPLRQYIVQQGATVVVVDNRGTFNRGSVFEASNRGQLGWSEVADQAAAVRQLAARGELDPGGVGIVGGSYGGFMTILSMALEPELFRVGVAIAPVTEWTGYDTAYTERYLGLPAANTDAYERSSVLRKAGAVVGDLLLIHGTIDENVHLRHSVRLVEAFRSAGRELPLIELPEQRHTTRGESLGVRNALAVAHLLRGLGLPLPRELA